MSSWRSVFAGLAAAFAVVTLWLILVLPADLRDLGPRLLLLIPAEGLVLLAIMLWAPERQLTRILRWSGWLIAALLVVRLLDLGFDAVFDRPLDLVNDWVYLRAGVDVVAYEYGWWGAVLAGLVLLGCIAAVVGLLPRVLGRVAGVARSHRRACVSILVVLSVMWAGAAGLGWRTSPRTPVAAHTVVDLVVNKVTQSAAALRDRRTFEEQIATDPFADAPASGILAGLRGKDVLVVFVESYGRVAIEDPSISPGVDRVLDEGTRRLADDGFAMCSGFLTSPTFGAASWLGHSTLQSGLWVDSQYRYNRLLQEERLTLTSAFRRGGWRTVTYAPAITKPWPEGERFYGFDELVRGSGLSYAGPRFGFESVPDQFTLARLAERELSRPPGGRAALMAEVNLISSHHPWTPIPQLVPWSAATSPGAYADQASEQVSQNELFADPEAVRAAYAKAIEYSLASVVSFVETYGDDDLVVLLLGDHQPHSYVSGVEASHDVPVSLIAGDAAVLAAIADWGWEPGLNPSSDVPVTRMDGLRDRLLSSFAAPTAAASTTSCG